MFAAQRELTLGKVRPDGMLQALLLFGFAAMLAAVAESVHVREPAEREGMHGDVTHGDVTHGDVTHGDVTHGNVTHEGVPPSGLRLRAQVGYGALMGLSFGLAYLTKSFAFLVALMSFAAVGLFLRLCLRRTTVEALLPGGVGFLVFALLAGPYMAALSHQKHRLDFGDSGSLNYAWYVGGTEKFHLEPWQTERFGSSEVHLLHPERQLLAKPGVYSYKAMPYGTIPPWFDTTFFNERIVTHLRVSQLLRRDARNVVLIVRYLVNHPEAWLLMGLLLALGARVAPHWRRAFWMLPVVMGVAIWAIYSIVNVEERYVTVGHLTLLLPLFAALHAEHAVGRRQGREGHDSLAGHASMLPAMAGAMTCLLVLLAMGESVRIAAENRRELSLQGVQPAWRNPAIFDAALELQALGVHAGDEVACIGSTACVNDPYWMRVAGVRTTTEVFLNDTHLAEDLEMMPNRDQVYRVVQGEGARALIGQFDPSHFTGAAAAGWVRLGETGYFALPLNLQKTKTTEQP